VRGATLFGNIDYRVARTQGEKEAIYALRYQAFLKSGLIPESDDKRVTDKYDDAMNSWVFGVYVAGHLKGSIRIHLLTKECRESLCVDRYGDILNPRLDRGEVFIDAARFVGDPDIDMLELPYMIMRLAFVACEAFDVDTELAACTPEHAKFYSKVFLHKQLTQPATFPGVNHQGVLMASDYKAVRDRLCQRLPILRSSAFERRMLFGVREQLPLPAAA